MELTDEQADALRAAISALDPTTTEFHMTADEADAHVAELRGMLGFEDDEDDDGA